MAVLTVLLFFVLLVVLVMSFVFYRKAKQMEQTQQLPAGYGGGFQPAGQLPGAGHGGGGGEPDLLNLRLNDIVSHFGTDYIIEGKLNYWDDGFTWVTYMLVDGDDVRWLAVEQDDFLDVTMWEPVHDLPLRAPLPEHVEYHGERYHMTERGQARVNQQGRTGNRTGMQMEYYEYESPSESYLSVEKWGSQIEASIGHEVNPAALEILPGDQIDY